ncbi:MAG: DHHA1 domain-containing protein [Chitinispirillia bacterium]|jgi:oligoribonuclease NrnB/cAMP/cGMP phosphodiesterase (DHH superfamily)
MKIERIVTRPDFDGVVCASLLKDIYGPDIPVIWLEPEEVKSECDLIKQGDVIANLPYSQNCSIYFDHHVTNNPPPDKPGSFSLAPSASGLVYSYYNNGQFSRDYSELVFQTDRIDSANLTKDEIIFPQKNPYLLLSMSLQSSAKNNEDYWNLLTDLMREKDIDEVLKNITVNRRTKEFLKYNKNYKNILISNTRIFKNIAVSDFRSFPRIVTGNRFLIYAVFPDIDISIKAFKTYRDNSSIHLSVAYNIFRSDKRINIGKLLKKFGGGGHPTAGGISIDILSYDSLLQKIVNSIFLQYEK